MASDLRPLGGAGNLGWYWVKHPGAFIGSPMGQGLRLVAIDEFGNVTRTRRRAEWDDAAPTEEEALLQHLSGAVAQADSNLKRFKRQHEHDPPKPPPPPADPATQRFLMEDPE